MFRIQVFEDQAQCPDVFGAEEKAKVQVLRDQRRTVENSGEPADDDEIELLNSKNLKKAVQAWDWLSPAFFSSKTSSRADSCLSRRPCGVSRRFDFKRFTSTPNATASEAAAFSGSSGGADRPTIGEFTLPQRAVPEDGGRS